MTDINHIQNLDTVPLFSHGKATKRASNGFDDLGIAPHLMKGINRLRFKNPTPIQKESIPMGIQGNDIIAVAQTGSGKTLA
ncbi:MAG: DEAD/DEAH box helicase, partial [candidate division Zixibacteria bacterium]|nr:DEAD/DEAH box helicase [candidate division Zixibacteria bacterium]